MIVHIFFKVEYIDKRIFFFLLFAFNSGRILKHSDKLLNGTQIGYLCISVLKRSDLFSTTPVPVKFTPVFHLGKKQFDSDWPSVKTENYYINLTYFNRKFILIIFFIILTTSRVG